MRNRIFWTPIGTGLIILTACLAVADTATNRYVVKDNPNAAAPYHTWDNAAPDIQTAIDAAVSANNDRVIVAPGVYDSGMTWDGDNNNRVDLRKYITVISRDNDPTTTIIKGAWDPVSTNGPGAVRCVRLRGSGAQLIGFTITNGATASITNGVDAGGGIYGHDGIISNCVITGNSASIGGGVYNANLYNCVVENNLAYQGGGSYFGNRYNCIFRRNRALYSGNTGGGGLRSGSAYNCLIEDNVSTAGGGAREVALYNCTIVNNIGSATASGTYFCTLYNCISWNNVDSTTVNPTVPYYSRGDGDAYLSNNCTQADPLFVDAANGNWRLRSSSPCIDAGTNQVWMATARDLDGRPRVNDAPDMGCYEYWSPGTILVVY